MPKRTDISKILIIGSGPIVIGQSAEFDYSGTQACKALKAEGYEVVLANSNPATIMTDPESADRTYIEPLTLEYLEEIIRIEREMGLRPKSPFFPGTLRLSLLAGARGRGGGRVERVSQPGKLLSRACKASSGPAYRERIEHCARNWGFLCFVSAL